MFHILENRVADAVSRFLRESRKVDVPVVVGAAQASSFGEMALPVAFSLAKQMKQAPRAIAEALAKEFPPVEGVAAVEIAGGGYLNIRLDRGYLRDGASCRGGE